MLYAYRSLCREIQTKLSVIRKLLLIKKQSSEQIAVDEMTNSLIIGNNKGLEELLRHKSYFDKSLKEKKYDDIKYIVYNFDKSPTLAFSGLIFPHYDFNGNLLQNIGDINKNLDLFIFCSAPMTCGWGYIVGWHMNSSVCSKKFYQSINLLSKKQSINDILFRLAFNLENIGISPDWWESLTSVDKQRIIEYVSESTNPLSEIRNTYLKHGLNGIVNWNLMKTIERIK